MKKYLTNVIALVLAVMLAGACAYADRPIDEVEGFWTDPGARLTLDICGRDFELLGAGGSTILKGKILLCVCRETTGDSSSYKLTILNGNGIVTAEARIVKNWVIIDYEEDGTPIFGEEDLCIEIEIPEKEDTRTYTLYAPGKEPTPYNEEFPVCYKPVIYLYPEKETEVSVKLDLNGVLTCTYPAYENGWSMTAMPDGALTDARGRQYDYLYWEGKVDFDADFTRGWCVKGDELVSFFEKTLSELGLTDSEANEFIVYWLPILQENAYNLISFDAASYCENAVLTADPVPDTVIRVYMMVKPLDAPMEIEAPELPDTPERAGFTLVEWGGSIID